MPTKNDDRDLSFSDEDIFFPKTCGCMMLTGALRENFKRGEPLRIP